MLLLASASPRRAELLTAAGIPFERLPVSLDESVLPGESPEAHVRRLAEAKARAALAMRPEALALGADTIVILDGRILGKPRDADDARAMLRALAGRQHEVLTGVALVAAESSVVEVSRTRVWFAAMTHVEIDEYIESGEPMDKAGAYGIQDAAGTWVRRIDGSYTGVVGLPLYETGELLRQAGLA